MHVIEENILLTKSVEKFKTLNMNDFLALELLSKEGEVFDLVFLDPPYAKEKIADVIEYLLHHKLLSPNGIVVCETDKEVLLPEKIEQWVAYKEAVYGITKLTFYKGE
jgi:16S rRNA (guanine966-N2)-methyltransferase